MPLNDFLTNTMAGVVIALLNITTAISIAALLFAGLPPEFFVTGVTILLLSTAVCALGGTFGSGFAGSIVAPRSGLAPVYAGMIASIAAVMDVNSAEAGLLPTTITAIMIATATTGLVLFVLGQFRLGSLVRYIPYPVMGGFFAGIGLIFLQGGISVSSGIPLSLDTASRYVEPGVLMLTAPAVVFGITLYIMQRRLGHWAVIPAALVFGVAGFYAVLGITGTSLSEAVAAGLLPEISQTSTSFPILGIEDIGRVDWSVVLSAAPSIATIAVLSAIILLLDTSGIEIVADCDLNPDRELKAAGLINVVNGALGGYTSVQAASDTALVVKLGGRNHLMIFVYAGIILVTMAVGTGVVAIVPTFVLGGLLAFLGLDFLVDWAWSSRRELPTPDYLIILAILLMIAAVGLLEGVAFGFLIAIVLFVISYSKLGIIKAEMGGDAHASHVVRSAEQRKILDAKGHQIWIMKLQGFIFFGTADKLLEAVRRRIEPSNESDGPDTAADSNENADNVKYLVLDFGHVSELDTSAVQAFAKLKKLAERSGLSLVLTELSPRARERLDAIGFFDDEARSANAAPRVSLAHLDDGVAWCEASILTNQESARPKSTGSVEALLARMVGDEAAARELAPFFEPESVAAGQFLFHQGDPGDSLFLLNSGVAAVVIALNRDNERIIRVFEQGTVLGEMALYTGAPRSAGVRIEEKAEVYRLSVDQFWRMQAAVPRAAGLFHAFVVRLLAERLERANREIQSLS